MTWPTRLRALASAAVGLLLGAAGAAAAAAVAPRCPFSPGEAVLCGPTSEVFVCTGPRLRPVPSRVWARVPRARRRARRLAGHGRACPQLRRCAAGPPLRTPAAVERLLAARAPRPALDVSASPSALPPLQPRKMGGYRSEEHAFWQQIYAPARTLGPLAMPSDRVQISLQDTELGPDGAFLDPAGTQRGILQLAAAAVDSDVFVTVGYPWTAASQAYISAGFPPGWETYWSTCYTTLAAALMSPAYSVGNKTLWIEIFGEPDLAAWSWIYGTDPARIFLAAKMVHDAFAPYRAAGRVRIGGMGFAFPESAFVPAFLAFYASAGMTFDFFSFHSYLGLTDADDVSAYPAKGELFDVGARNELFRAVLASAGLAGVPTLVSEYAWYDGDLLAAAGFGDPALSARDAIVGYRNCMRTLFSIDLIVAQTDLLRAYWAQGVGTVADDGVHPYIYAYDPFVVFDPARWQWRYKASYYAFWMYARMAGERLAVAVADPKLGVWAARNGSHVRVVAWNASPQPRDASLELPFVDLDSRCAMFAVDASTFALDATGDAAVINGPQALEPPRDAAVRTLADATAALARAPLAPEAVVMLEIAA